MGMLANKPQFFGGITAEVVSTTDSWGAWNGDAAQAFAASSPWPMLGGVSNTASLFGAGVFASGATSTAGGANGGVSHRTILLGY